MSVSFVGVALYGLLLSGQSSVSFHGLIVWFRSSFSFCACFSSPSSIFGLRLRSTVTFHVFVLFLFFLNGRLFSWFRLTVSPEDFVETQTKTNSLLSNPVVPHEALDFARRFQFMDSSPSDFVLRFCFFV